MRWFVLMLCFIQCNNKEIQILNTYDFVVVGSGAAGTVIANRLSANGENKVLLLEAGDTPNLLSEVPLLSPQLQLSKYDWNFESVPQNNCCSGLEGMKNRMPQGKILGGTGSINYMIYTRGNREDYDYWAKNGATGWEWENVLPYFMKHENNQDAEFIGNGFHGTEGELFVQQPPYYTPLSNYYIEGAKELGFEEGDCNGPVQSVFMKPQGTIKSGRRWSTSKAFIEPIIGRQNLHILCSAFVTKIQFDKNKRANGITFDYSKKIRTIEVTKEIIISSGAINSAKLLLLSGIGPKEDLEQLGITVISDIPVGQNLQNHVSCGGVNFVIDKPYSFLPERITKEDYLDFLKYDKGPLTSLVGIETIGFVSSKYNIHPEWPDLEIVITGASPASMRGDQKLGSRNANKQIHTQVLSPYAFNDTISCQPVIMHPKSRGFLRLKSIDPYDSPVIDPKYFSDENDLKVLVEGMKICLAWSSTRAMKELGTRPFSTKFPGCEKFNTDSDEYLSCVAQVYTFVMNHFSGTNKMGDPSDQTTVVDPNLRVKGTLGLRVADASIMPTVITGHTHAPAIMIGEKAADLILQDW